jgi:hypothetical protein
MGPAWDERDQRVTWGCWEKGVYTIEHANRITGLGSGRAHAGRPLELGRGHRGIRNRPHDVRIITPGEAACRVRSRNAPHVLAAARILNLALLRPLQLASIATATRRIVMHTIGGVRRILGQR